METSDVALDTPPLAPIVAPTRSAAAPGDIVLLTHGIASTRWFMWPLARRLLRQGFDARLYTYFTLRGSNRAIGQQFAQYVCELAERHPGRTIHVVAHSMGSIVTRCAIAAGLPECVGRVVMIGPPNRGSHVARALAPLLGWIAPTLAELSDAEASFVNSLPRRLERQVGIIAAARDRVVRLDSTLLEDHAGYVVLPYRHTSILWTPEVAHHVAHFLQHGTFAEEEASQRVSTARV